MNNPIRTSWGKGFLRFVAAMTLGVFVGNLAAAAQEEETPKKKVGLSLKLSGGVGYLLNGAGDVNDYRQGQKAILSDLYAHDGYTTAFDWRRPGFVPDATADIIFHVGPHFGFGFGSGYILGSSRGSYAVHYQASSTSWGYQYAADSKYEYRPDYQLRAVPLKFDLYLFQPLGKARRLTLFARAGAGYYLGRIKIGLPYQSTSERSSSYDFGTYNSLSASQIDIAGSAKCNTWGFQGGLGLELKLSRAISLGAEISGRAVNFKNWEGDLSWTGKGNYTYESPYSYYESTATVNEKWHGFLWTYQIRDDETKKTYTYMMLFEKQPNGEYYENVRKTALNLNALSLALSVKVHFELF